MIQSAYDHKAAMRLLDERAAVLLKAKAIPARCRTEGRQNLTLAEEQQFDAHMGRINSIDVELAAHNKQRDAEKRLRIIDDPNQLAHENSMYGGQRTQTGIQKMASSMSTYTRDKFDQGDPESVWLDRQGNEITMLSPSQQMPTPRSKRLHLGKYLVGAITGRWSDDSEAERLAMGGNTNIGGALLVPDVLSNEIIDLARAKSVLFQAGCRTIPMTSDNLTLARVITDPSFQVKAENAAFSGTQVSFDGIGFFARVIGNYVLASRELCEDAPNAADLIQETLAKALAVALDDYGLVGTGSAQPVGITNYPTGVGNTGSIGTLAWSHLQTAVKGVRIANGEPNAYVCSPTTQNRLASQVTGDGVNASKNWLGPPRNVEQLTELVTTNCPDGTIIVGDFTKAIFGVRQEASIEVTREGAGTFEKHQVGIKIVWRGDFNLSYPSHFYTLTGITA